MTLMVLTVSCGHTYAQTHQTVHTETVRMSITQAV